MSSHQSEIMRIEEFLKLAGITPVIDVRSPAEYKTGHIPEALNIPLFDDYQRAVVGTSYKREGRRKAILKGIELTGPEIHIRLQKAIGIAKENKLLIYCWRGGMRSEAMAWLFSLGDINTAVLEGGYKSYRNHVLFILANKRKVIVLGGMTGSSKTHILKRISEMGRQVIDLEGLANHKGSAFGALGQPPQPTSEHFANLLFDRWRRVDCTRPVWLEDESKNIGTVFMPDVFLEHIHSSPAIILMMKTALRLPRLIEEYSVYPPGELKEAVLKINKRLGGDNTRDALKAVDDGDFAKAIEITLKYYDKTYMYGISAKHSGRIIYVETDTSDIETNAMKVLEAAEKIAF